MHLLGIGEAEPCLPGTAPLEQRARYKCLNGDSRSKAVPSCYISLLLEPQKVIHNVPVPVQYKKIQRDYLQEPGGMASH